MSDLWKMRNDARGRAELDNKSFGVEFLRVVWRLNLMFGRCRLRIIVGLLVVSRKYLTNNQPLVPRIRDPSTSSAQVVEPFGRRAKIQRPALFFPQGLVGLWSRASLLRRQFGMHGRGDILLHQSYAQSGEQSWRRHTNIHSPRIIRCHFLPKGPS